MLANNRRFTATPIVLLENRVGCAYKLLLANLYTNLVQSSDILDQRSLLHLRQLIIYWLFGCSRPYALEPSIDALTSYSIHAGYDSDDNALPGVPFFVDLCGSPICKFMLNPIRKLHTGVEILTKIWDVYRRVHKMPITAGCLLRPDARYGGGYSFVQVACRGPTPCEWGKHSAHHHWLRIAPTLALEDSALSAPCPDAIL
jgi:hypothetical protein